MALRKTTEDFIAEAKQIHGDEYDYSLVEYKNTYEHVKIICKKHGVFQQRPRTHIKAPNGCKCPNCAIEEHPNHQTMTKNEFISKANVVHGKLYDYTNVEYKRGDIKVDIKCNECEHTFRMRPVMHLYGQGCPACAKRRRGDGVRLSQEEFIIRLHEKYGDGFDYSNIKYTKLADNVTIRCKDHNLTFTKRGAYLLDNKFSCPQCMKELRQKVEHTDGPGIYHINRTTLDTSKMAMLYIIQLANDTETFYKVGVTVNNVKKRYSSKLIVAGYKITIISETRMLLGEAISKEHEIVSNYKSHRYIPVNIFSGYTECLSVCPVV